MIKKLQNFYLYSYRSIGFLFLFGLIFSIAWYVISILFFTVNRHWSVPLIISPGQEKVITHLEHMLNIEHQLSLDIAELKMDKKAVRKKEGELAKVRSIHVRVKQSIHAQSKQYKKLSHIFNSLTEEKEKNVQDLTELLAETNLKEKNIKRELQLGLITKQEALTQRLSLENLRSGLIDAKEKAFELHQRSLDFGFAADTLNGASQHLVAMNNVTKKMELENKISELNTEIYSLNIKTKQLVKNIEKRRAALKVLRDNPYILATKKPVDVAFVPYRNVKNIQVGSPVYSCYLDMVFCYRSGRVMSLYHAEEHGRHPVFQSEIKGMYVRIAFDDEEDAQRKLLFFHSKPLLF